MRSLLRAQAAVPLWQLAHIARENRMDKLEQQVRDALGIPHFGACHEALADTQVVVPGLL